MKTNYATFQSPFSWRYGSDQMRQIFSEQNKFLTWRKLWVELARVQYQYKLVSKKELDDLIKNEKNIDIHRIQEIELDTKHDTVAAIKEFAEKAKLGGGKIHLGATSMDIVDNTDSIRTKEALELVEQNIKLLLAIFSEKIVQLLDHPTLAYTHLQAAEPTTIGYRLSMYAQDLLLDFEQLHFVKNQMKAKGFKGAVGTGASYTKLVGEKESLNLEEQVMQRLGINSSLIAGQTAPRKFDVLVAQCLSSIAQTLHKFAFDLRILQSAGIREGDMVLAERTTQAKTGAIVIAELDGQFTMKYLRKQGSYFFLEPANKNYPPLYPKESLRVVAVVKAIIRKFA
jgi:adenylosuccinate lyase